MEDKEVGELWRRLITMQKQDDHICPDDVLPLIHKLVEERRRMLEKLSPDRCMGNLPEALRDFGIDPATWGEK